MTLLGAVSALSGFREGHDVGVLRQRCLPGILFAGSGGGKRGFGGSGKGHFRRGPAGESVVRFLRTPGLCGNAAERDACLTNRAFLNVKSHDCRSKREFVTGAVS